MALIELIGCQLIQTNMPQKINHLYSALFAIDIISFANVNVNQMEIFFSISAYYMSGLDDRLLVERLINTCLVPFNLETTERMKKLLLLFSTIDENASKAFIEVQKSQRQVQPHLDFQICFTFLLWYFHIVTWLKLELVRLCSFEWQVLKWKLF